MTNTDFRTSLKKISTPWKVAFERANRISKHRLKQGWIVDPACGSATQLGAYALANKMPAIGIEIDKKRAEFAIENISKILSEESELLSNSEILCSSGLEIPEIILQGKKKVSLLHVDPARPDNMQEHTIEEMQPNPLEIIRNWKDYLGKENEDLAIIIDLSPRLSEDQIIEISEQLKNIFPEINQTWEWTSQGQGRIDRLSVWLGKIATKGSNARFVRILPKIDQESIIVNGNIESFFVQQKEFSGEIKIGMWVTILDSALVSSNLSEQWLSEIKCDKFEWVSKYGRRPKIIHSTKLDIPEKQIKLVSSSGSVTKIYNRFQIDDLIEDALELNYSKLKLRMKVDPKLQPILQSKIDRALKINISGREGFICSISEEILCLCSFN